MLFWMMLAAGLVLVAFVFVDILWSTISTQGGGPLTQVVTRGCWRLARWHFGLTGRHGILQTNAVVTLVVTFLVWVVVLWLGWTLIFSAGEQIVVHQMSHEPSSIVDRFYFAGMVLLTLGTGDLVASTPGWRLVSMISSFTGLFVITVTISYLLSVTAAAIEKRRLALAIDALGQSGEEILEFGWNGRDFSVLDDQLNEIARELMLHAERHLSYPVLQYFHSRDAEAALPPSVAKLDDVTTLLRCCLSEKGGIDRAALRVLRSAIDDYIHRIDLAESGSQESSAPMPDIESLRARGVPVADVESCRQAFEERRQLRARLRALVEVEGWQWPESSDCHEG